MSDLTERKEYWQGVDASTENKPKELCPYISPRRKTARKAWLMGWIAAETNKRDQLNQ